MQRGLTPPAPTGPPRTMSQMFDFLRRMQRGQACRLSKDYAGERGRRRVVVRRYGRRVGILQAHPSVNVGRLVRGEIRWVLARAGSICRSASIRASRASGGLPECVPDFVELSMCQHLHACLSASLLCFLPHMSIVFLPSCRSLFWPQLRGAPERHHGVGLDVYSQVLLPDKP